MNHRVVITGLGIHSCLGGNAEEVTASLREGRSGIIFDPVRKEMGFRSALVGNVPMPELKAELGRKDRKNMPEEALYAFVSTKQALEMAGMTQEFIDQNEVGILFGNDSTAGAVIEGVDLLREKKDTTLIGSGNIFQSMNCTVTMNLSTIFRLKGVNFTVSAACASGSHSIGMGFLLIKMGLQKQVICGGAQEVNPYAFGSFDGIGTFSIQEHEPTKASKPFDKNRDGLVPSGGAATVILESLESAQARGANILAEVVGYGFSSNGEHISNPNEEGQARALKMAMEMGNVKPEEVDYINAHATSTPVGDAFEAQAIYSVFGDNGPLVSSTKSMTGHECWMAGASEIVYSLLMMQHGFVAPNINFSEPDEASAKLKIPTKSVDKELNTILSNSFGFGGTNSTLIIRKFAP
jgi:3-oxoacyl-[acyl-carrier-protein] synthase-1